MMDEEEMMDDQPNSMTRFPIDIRLEMLVGHLADQLPTVDEIKTLRLQSNASVTTRSRLDYLIELTGALWKTLEAVREEAAAIRKAAAIDTTTTINPTNGERQ